MIDPQYHFRKVGERVHIWNVRKLATLAKDLDVIEVPLDQIREIDEPYWFECTGDTPTGRRILEHVTQWQDVDLAHPILLCSDGRIFDGMHRVMKALAFGQKTIKAKRFAATPPPDYYDKKPDELPY